jgi:hypothetical protein
LIFLLATVCIGGSELVACQLVDPILYERITMPVRHQINKILDGAATAVSNAASFLHKNEDAPLEDQFAGDPATTSTLPEADPSVTALEQRQNGEVLTGGSREIVYYNQADAEWYDQPYGRDTIGKYGCGPSALAMAVSSLTNQMVDPIEMSLWASQNGYWARHSGSYLSIVDGAAASFGLMTESCPACDVGHLRLELSAGKIGMALMTKGHFTQSGHFILLRGTTLDGGILVADPNSRDRSLMVWDAQLILDELSTSRNNGAPLWFLSPAKDK